jgi:hypothetical protein
MMAHKKEISSWEAYELKDISENIVVDAKNFL